MWSSCVEMPNQRPFLASCAAKGHQTHGADIQDAHAHAKASRVKTCMRADDAQIEWAKEVLRKEIKRGSVMEALHSLQGHLGFSTTTRDGCVCKRTDSEGTISILPQVDDHLIATTDQAMAERITKWNGERVKF